MTSRADHQLNLPATEVLNCSDQLAARTNDSSARSTSNRAELPRTNHSSDDEPRMNLSDDPFVLASLMFDGCMKDARLETKEVASLCGVTDSLVNRWRSPNYQESPSLVHLLRLPAAFHWALVKRLVKRFAFGQRAIAEAVEAQNVWAAVVGQ